MDNCNEVNGSVEPVEHAPTTKQRQKVCIPESNRGYQLLRSMGWKENTGLGIYEDGRIEPIATVLKQDRAGLGMPTRKAKITHHLKPPKRKAETPSVFNMTKAQRFKLQTKEKQRERNIAMELYSTELEGYEEYFR